MRTPWPQLGTFFWRALTHYSNSRNSKLVPGRCATHLSTCGCARRQDHVCANRLTDPCFPQPYSNRRFIFLNSLANASLIKEPNVRSTAVSETAAVLLRFASTKQKIGDAKMNRHDRELLDKQMRRLSPPRNDGAIAVMFAAMFLVGMALGGVLSTHESEPIQIASME